MAGNALLQCVQSAPSPAEPSIPTGSPMLIRTYSIEDCDADDTATVKSDGADAPATNIQCLVCLRYIPHNAQYIQHYGGAYCKDDYAAMLAPLCEKCKSPIRNKILLALGRTWHVNHFSCGSCGALLSDDSQHMNGDPLCLDCYCSKKKEIKSYLCATCEGPVDLTAHYYDLNGVYLHTNHVQCSLCGKALGIENCRLRGTQITCMRECGMLKKCIRCHNTVSIGGIVINGYYYHMDHFTCCKCGIQLDRATVCPIDGDIYCKTHYNILKSRECVVCGHTTAKCYRENNTHWCIDHFMCTSCGTRFNKGSKYINIDARLLCRPCFGLLQLPLRIQILYTVRKFRARMKSGERRTDIS